MPGLQIGEASGDSAIRSSASSTAATSSAPRPGLRSSYHSAPPATPPRLRVGRGGRGSSSGEPREDPSWNSGPLRCRLRARGGGLLTSDQLRLPRLIPAGVGRAIDARDQLRRDGEALVLGESERLVEKLGCRRGHAPSVADPSADLLGPRHFPSDVAVMLTLGARQRRVTVRRRC